MLLGKQRTDRAQTVRYACFKQQGATHPLFRTGLNTQSILCESATHHKSAAVPRGSQLITSGAERERQRQGEGENYEVRSTTHTVPGQAVKLLYLNTYTSYTSKVCMLQACVSHGKTNKQALVSGRLWKCVSLRAYILQTIRL